MHDIFDPELSSVMHDKSRIFDFNLEEPATAAKLASEIPSSASYQTTTHKHTESWTRKSDAKFVTLTFQLVPSQTTMYIDGRLDTDIFWHLQLNLRDAYLLRIEYTTHSEYELHLQNTSYSTMLCSSRRKSIICNVLKRVTKFIKDFQLKDGNGLDSATLDVV